MFLPDLVLRSRRVVTPQGTRPAAIHIRRGRIIGVLEFDEVLPDAPVDDVDSVIIPGLVDTHVHVGDDFERATADAAAGGVTTIGVLSPPGEAPITNEAALEARRRAADGRCHVDVAFWGGIAQPSDLAPLFSSGVLGFETSTDSVEPDPMREMTRIGATLLAHAESTASAARKRFGRPRYAAHLGRHPKANETEGIVRAIALAREHHTRTHIAHLSSSDALTPLFRAQAAHLPVSAETCPHYLTLVADEIPDDAPAFLCNPPIRERENREYLWASVASGLIRMVVSDDVAVPAAQSCGLRSLALSLPVVWTGARARGCTLNQVVEWMCRSPAQLGDLRRKGKIDVGFDADLVVFDPDAEFTVDTPFSPYFGKLVAGLVERTYVGGVRVQREKPRGRFIGRGAG